MTTPLHQAILDAFFTAVSADNASGNLSEARQQDIQRYVTNWRERQAAAASKPKVWTPIQENGAPPGAYGTSTATRRTAKKTERAERSLWDN